MRVRNEKWSSLWVGKMYKQSYAKIKQPTTTIYSSLPNTSNHQTFKQLPFIHFLSQCLRNHSTITWKLPIDSYCEKILRPDSALECK